MHSVTEFGFGLTVVFQHYAGAFAGYFGAALASRCEFSMLWSTA